MSTPLTLIATITAAPGHAEALERELRALVAPSRAEAGCLQYDLHQDRHDSHLFYMIEQWRDDAPWSGTRTPNTSCASAAATKPCCRT